MFTAYVQAENRSCGVVFQDTFDQAGSLPGEWTEYNTTGRVTVENGYMKFDHNTTKPSAYRTFAPVSKNVSFSFDVQASRNSVNCQIHLVSSTGKYLASMAVGKNSTATIKYATTMTAGVPEGFIDGSPKITLVTNTVYSLSSYIDFTNQTVDFYCNGSLMAAAVPYLETTSDVAKVDIQLIYMYSNTGTFLFDNISLITTDNERLSLTAEVATSQKLITEATVGDGYLQYSQAAVDVFTQAVDVANIVVANCDATTVTLSTTLADLQAAKADFLTKQNNPAVLKHYSAYGFTGEVADFKCGYYNGTLGVNNDWAVSFKLEKGYMVTFAQDVNGLGVSKVYIAQNEALAINLPEALQHSISFVRVSPWHSVGKKGSLGRVY